MELYIFETPTETKKFKSLDSAERYKTKCENDGLTLIAYGGNIWNGFTWVYSDTD